MTVFVYSIRIINEADLIADADSVVNPPEDLRPLESLVPGADVVRVTDVLDQQLGRHVDLALENSLKNFIRETLYWMFSPCKDIFFFPLHFSSFQQ